MNLVTMLLRLVVFGWFICALTIAVKCGKGLKNCDGECVDLQTNTDHCGKCGTSCAQFQLNCIDGACQHASKDCAKYGEAKCNGYCYNLKTSPQHCGSCGNYCTTGQSCQNGVCQEFSTKCGAAYSTCENYVYCGQGGCGFCRRGSDGTNHCTQPCQIFGDCTEDSECTKQSGGICTHDTCRSDKGNRGTCCYPNKGCQNEMRARNLFAGLTV